MSALAAPRPIPSLVVSECVASPDEALRRWHDLADALLAGGPSSKPDGISAEEPKKKVRPPLQLRLEEPKKEARPPLQFPVDNAARIESLEHEISLLRKENARLEGELANALNAMREEIAELRATVASVRASANEADALAERAIEAMEAIRHWAMAGK